MKPLILYLCLSAIVFHAIFASLSLNGSASLSSNKTAPFKSRKPHSKAKPVAGKLICKEEPPRTKKKPQNIRSKSKNVLVKENELKLLIELLSKELVEIVIGYFKDDTYPFIISTHDWALEAITGIAVDSARVYVLTNVEGIKSLDHSLVNVKEDERRLVEFSGPKWSNYHRFSSSHDGRYVSFSHEYKVLIAFGEHTMRSAKWLMKSNESEDGRLKRVTFDGKESPYGLLSRDGKTLCFYSYNDSITRVYRLREEAGKNHIRFRKCKLNGTACAVSGNANRVMVESEDGFEIHDISKDASKLICEIDTICRYACALNEDGSEAAFAAKNNELRVMEADKVNGSAMDQPAIVTVKVSESLGYIYKLVYSDDGKLHVLHSEGKVSLFDPSTKELILLDAPEEGKGFIDSAISPNADYIAVIRYIGKGENGKYIYETIVKRKCKDSDWKDLFRCEVDTNKQAAKL